MSKFSGMGMTKLWNVTTDREEIGVDWLKEMKKVEDEDAQQAQRKPAANAGTP